MEEKKDQGPTNEEFFAVFQTDPVGNAIFNHLYIKFLTNKRFHADPYINAYNSGMAEVINYLVIRQRETVAEQDEKYNKWSVE